MRPLPLLRPLLALALLLTVGCTNKNVPLNAMNVPLERWTKNHTRASTTLDTAPAPDAPTTRPGSRNHTGYFVGIAISGGGSRSANFSAACLLQLQRVGLLQHADYISSVSGGSLTAAYYCLNGDDAWNPGNVQRKLTHPFAQDLLWQWLMPWNTLATTFSDYDRTDMLAGVFQQQLFSRNGRGLTFGDLRPDRPHLLINSTDLQSGRRFVFSDESFDDLNSDLSNYPISWAVAASAAVPILLHQVTLRDYSTVYKQYRHFIDGGISDNLGVQTLIETYDTQTRAAAQRKEPPPYPKGVVLIILDAKTNFNARLSDKGDITFLESLRFGSGLTSTALLNRASTATLADLIVKYSPGNTTADQLRKQIAAIETTGYLKTEAADGTPVHILHVALAQVGDISKVPFHNFRESLDNIDTYFNITETDAYNLYQAAELLMTQKFDKILEPLIADMNGHPATVR